MSPPQSPTEAQTPRPAETDSILNNQQNQQDVSTPQSGDSHAISQDGRKSFTSSLSARSSVSLSTTYSSPDDDRSEVGELPDNHGTSKEQSLQVGKHGGSDGDTVSLDTVAMEGDGQVEKLEKQLANMDVQQTQGAGQVEDDDDDSYLNDPLVKYTMQLHDYTKRLYIESRIQHEKLQQDRSRGGRAGKSGIEAMGRKTAPPPRY
ncbi:hypothetical protein QFC22_001098 [Naganishia vaughanmartiniae]|uniref:Uncharacterized protein n=1 Tax=Naganishia vaughanmartiniae TaxID=1424756 RepID=A0ACC2XJX7_9TREE|nr:hypothetical protein QFC22_001098 [Naganishia vaughanmartiniae]